MMRGSLEPGQSVSVVARRNGINPNQLFHWRKLYQDGSLSAVSAGEAVVPASELADALKQIRELQRMLGKKTMEAEILKEAVEIARSRKWIAHSPCCRGTVDSIGRRNTLVCSMSAVGHCGDNAACEGFFGLLKRERVAHQSYRTCDEARADLFDYIERFHNPRMRRRVDRQDLKFSAFFKPSVEIG